VGWEKVACWRTKAAISLLRVKIESRYIHMVHLNQSPLKILEKVERGRIQRLPKVFSNPPLLSHDRVKLRTSNFVRTFMGQLEQKPIKNLEKSSRGLLRDSRKFSGHPYYRGHRAVIFTVAHLSCYGSPRPRYNARAE